jgi:hypothetical protein
MKIIKKILFPAIIFVIVNCISSKEAIAQVPDDAQKKEQNKEKMEQREAAYNAMLDSLQLTDQQREDVDFINMKYRAQMQQIRQNSEGDFEAMRPAMVELRDNQNAELKEILSEEQFAQYQKWQKENRGRRGRGGPPRN